VLDGLVAVKLWAVVAAFERRLSAELAGFGLSVAAFRLIGEVMREPDGVRQGELARRLGVKPPTVSIALAGLERDGMVVRFPDPADPRARLVCLAPDASLLGGVDVLGRIDAVLTDGLSEGDRVRLGEVLDTLADRLRSSPEAPE
jgi:DNA-binding MarR family transcriptional regulator